MFYSSVTVYGDWTFDFLNEAFFLSSFALLVLLLGGAGRAKATWIKDGLVWFLCVFSLLCFFDVLFLLFLYSLPNFQVTFDKFQITPFSILGITAVKALVSFVAFLMAIIRAIAFKERRIA